MPEGTIHFAAVFELLVLREPPFSACSFSLPVEWGRVTFHPTRMHQHQTSSLTMGTRYIRIRLEWERLVRLSVCHCPLGHLPSDQTQEIETACRQFGQIVRDYVRLHHWPLANEPQAV